ncbi:MAG: hypothetical protein O2897_02480 [bacterium]|nr:hypothetical protein [bacterium]
MLKEKSLPILTLDLLRMEEDLFLSTVNKIIQNSLSRLESRCNRKLILPAQKGLLLFSKKKCEADLKIDELKETLAFLNEQYDNSYCGFSQLLETFYEDDSMENNEAEHCVEFVEKVELSYLDNTVSALEFLYDIVDSFAIEANAIFASFVLEGIFYETLKSFPQKTTVTPFETILDRWVDLSACSVWLKQIWPLRNLVYEIAPQVCSKLNSTRMHQLYCVWFLTNRLVNQKPIEGFTRNLLDTLLRRAEMAPLVVFENAGLIP